MGAPDDTDPIRVLIADDEALVRGGFRVLIDTEPGMTEVGEAADGAAAAELARQTHPHVVLMDIRMSGVDGLRPPAGSPPTPTSPASTSSSSPPSTTTSMSSRRSAQVPPAS